MSIETIQDALCIECKASNDTRNRRCSFCSKKVNKFAKNRRLLIKEEGFKLLGGAKCACCGINKISFLTFDHIKPVPSYTREGSSRISLKVVRSTKNLRILCYNCNSGRAFNVNRGICPHERIVELPLPSSYLGKRLRRLKLEAFEAIGRKSCDCCKEPQFKFLSISRIDGIRISDAATKYLRVKSNPLEFNILCFNCRRAKLANNGVCI